MNKNITILICIILPLLISCISEYNPFSDLAHAVMMIEKKTFTDGEEIAIFSAETLSIRPMVTTYIDSFTVHADNNRFWNDDDTTIINNDNLASQYTFNISFNDTGVKQISVTTFRTDTLPYLERFSVYAYSPLRQDAIIAYVGKTSKSIHLKTAPVSDNQIKYHWQLGKYHVSSLANSVDTNFLEAIADTIGLVFVTDWDNIDTSPAAVFTFSLIDTIKPTIRCMTDSLIPNTDTIITGDSILFFRVRVYDQDTTAVKAAFVSFDSAAINYTENNDYISLVENMPNFTNTPNPFIVRAIDNSLSNNQAVDTFYLRFNPSLTPTNKVYILLDSLDTTSQDAIYNIAGKVYSKKIDTVVLTVSVNGIVTNAPQTTYNQHRNWTWALSLTKKGINSVIITAKNSIDDTIKLAEKSVTIYHDPDLVDSIGPVFREITVDGESVESRDSTVVGTDSPTFIVHAFDVHSTIDWLKINDTIAPFSSTDSTTFIKKTLVKHPWKESRVILEAKDIFNHSTKDTIYVACNTLPVVTRDHLRNNKINVGAHYLDTIKITSSDPDPIIVKLIDPGIPAVWHINGRYLTFTPDSSLLGKDTVRFKIYDGYDSTRIYAWDYEVVDSGSLDSVKFSSTLADKLPRWLIANQDSLSLTLDVVSGTPPLRFSAFIPALGDTLLDDTSKNSFTWKPLDTDTGKQILYCYVKDSLKTSDAFFHTFTVLPQNSNLCTLSYKVSPATVLSGTIIDLRDSASALVTFTIHDKDNPLNEKYTITITSSDNTVSFTTDSLQFTRLIKPQLNRDDEQITVTVADAQAHTFTVIFSVLYQRYYTPQQIANLKYWFDANDSVTVLKIDNFPCKAGDSVASWKNLASNSDLSQTSQPLRPLYKINPERSISFIRANKSCFKIADAGDWTSSKFSYFVIAKLNQNSPDSIYTLLSSNTLSGSFNLGVAKENVGAYNIVSNALDSVSVSNKLKVPKDSFSLFSFQTQLTRGNLTVGLNGNLDSSIQMELHQYTDLMVGGNTFSTPLDTWNGPIREIIFYTDQIQGKYYQGLMQYLTKKYGIAIKTN